MKKNQLLLIFFLLVALTLTGCVKKGYGQLVKFETPDIKDDFCGVHLNFQYCKCAFHNEYCDAVGMNKSQANNYVNEEFDKWVAGLVEDFLLQCTAAGGITKDEACQYCEEGYRVSGDECVDLNQLTEDSEQDTAFTPDGPLNNDCTIVPDEFDADWKKYSDIDEVIPFEDRSYEAKQALTVYDEMIEKMVEAFELERDIEIENQLQTELLTYREALVQNIKTNLLKSFWRLSWVTYTTIQSGKGVGESYNTLLTSGASAETIGAGLKVIQGVIPGDSALAIDTSTVTGKAKSVGAAVALEAIDSLGDPTKIATELFKSAANAPLPSADISPEEVAILRDQHLTKGAIDEILADSQAANQAREARLATLEQEISALQTQVDDWEVKEKERVKFNLEDSCKSQRDKK